MDLEPGTTRVFRCRLCGVDTPHRICHRKNDRYAIACTGCHGGALVAGEELLRYQAQWEAELRELLERLSDEDDTDEDGSP